MHAEPVLDPNYPTDLAAQVAPSRWLFDQYFQQNRPIDLQRSATTRNRLRSDREFRLAIDLFKKNHPAP